MVISTHTGTSNSTAVLRQRTTALQRYQLDEAGDLRPIIMQSDLHSVVHFSTFTRVLDPENGEIVFLFSEWAQPFSKTLLEQFAASAGAQLQEIAAGTFSIQLGQVRLRSPNGSKKRWVFLKTRSRIVIVF